MSYVPCYGSVHLIICVIPWERLVTMFKEAERLIIAITDLDGWCVLEDTAGLEI